MKAWRAGAVPLVVLFLTIVAAPAAVGTVSPNCYGQNNTISGTDNPDTIDGTASADVVSLGDSYPGLPSGIDIASGNNGSDRLCGNGDIDNLYGNDGNDRLDGQQGPDTVYGNNNDDILDGGSAYDYLYGHGGSDTLDGGDDSDSVLGMDGQDVVQGGPQSDTLYDGDAFDEVHGNSGANDTWKACDDGIVDSVSAIDTIIWGQNGSYC